MAYLDTEDPVAAATAKAIHSGDTTGLRRLLETHPGLATVRLGDEGGMSRTLLHVVTDWPGHYPNGPQTVAVLVAAGADLNAPFEGGHTERPLHWAASSDDVPVLDALLDAGADIEAPGSCIGTGGTAMTDACAFGQWNAARRLVERGASTTLWESATLGLMDRIITHFTGGRQPDAETITHGLWSSCHGGQRASAQFFLERGADINWVGYDDLTPLDAALRTGAADLAAWLRTQGARSTADLT
ncbi:ankyrin repeat domain-containing protein [Streptosporangium sp. NBC_01755]|uniref:ankyrin repeat domain-containing protein n=1 Tax=unclassified Streptosporangium TaxID=2632669 RepID=UPI002DD91B65|nr:MULTISPECIES: ankyrin repeat domain-containing protein [unclassified Streptosporangium]WSA28422.1 ankyrin repeat domain-containing protein [Streptosporangium sp. NBC_01810]WSD00088.1 ankyrin repeat domain-containing protein [Streptosporangium sp. NBC_01755]